MKTLITVLLILVALLTGIYFIAVSKVSAPTLNVKSASNFDECVAEGNAVMESYPRQCRSKLGILFVENVAIPVPEQVSSSTPVTPVTPTPTLGKCFVGGCSGQICSDQEGMASTCEYREEYACYKTARCERQNNGQCGWTQSLPLLMCLNSALNI